MARADHIIFFLFTGRPPTPTYESITHDDGFGPVALPYARWHWLALNHYGFNDSDNYTLAHRAHRIRILVLGDSIAMGSATDVGNWPQQLEQLLQQRGYDVEVVNAAQSAASFESTIERYQAWEHNFKPDIVLFQKEARSMMTAGSDWPALIWPLRTLNPHSAFTTKLTAFKPQNVATALTWQRVRYGAWHLTQHMPASQFVGYTHYLDQLHQTATADGSQLVLVTVPTSTSLQDYQKNPAVGTGITYFFPWLSASATLEGMDLMNDYLITYSKQQQDVSAIDLRTAIPATDPSLFTDYFHYTRTGTERVATSIADQLLPALNKLAP